MWCAHLFNNIKYANETNQQSYDFNCEIVFSDGAPTRLKRIRGRRKHYEPSVSIINIRVGNIIIIIRL